MVDVKDFVPLFGICLAGFFIYLSYRENQWKFKENQTLIEKGMDPIHFVPRRRNQTQEPSKNQLIYKIGLLFIGVALGILVGYLLSTTLNIPNLVAYSSTILVFCGILLVYFHKSKIE